LMMFRHTEILLLFLAGMVLTLVGNPGQGSSVDVAISVVRSLWRRISDILCNL